MTAYNPIPPTRLYCKQCSHCELKYYGKSVKKNLERYKGSGKRWVRHLKKHNATSIHIWNSDWFYDDSIIEVAMKFSIDNNIIESNEWANLSIENGIDGGIPTKKSIEKMLKTRDDPLWKETIGKETKEKMSKTKSDPVWKETVGKKQTEKILKTKSDPLWQETIGKKSKEKMSKTKSDPVWKKTVGKIGAIKRAKALIRTISDPLWKETVGKKAKEKELKTKSDPVWKETVGKKAKEKELKTKSDPVWKEKDAKICPHCNIKIDSGNYAKLHGDKCRHKPLINKI
jgi:hypothetical protein